MYTIQNANSNSTNRTSSNPAPRHSIHSKQGPFAVTNPRDLTWAIYRSFDAPWQQWRGRRTSAALPCSGENPRVPHFSIIIRGKNDADDGVGGVDDDDDDVHAGVNVQPGETWRETGADPDMDVEMEGVEERIENRLTGDELAMVLRAIIREPVPDRR
ncbi:hypothetical protein N7539_003043 [Penicillium diatomitis]|uniref:Uncharacterized protein n=1 Tax=Penicillium diatomitis TaxID=2819901 RepID=A0A9W9XG35_9EURO|nr:uncharacterized protein N7539_003043 [Penicillium diatomitis]KAJ5491476.1 hypothetical protein N7539_003043 [Penicillium diatomitis]